MKQRQSRAITIHPIIVGILISLFLGLTFRHYYQRAITPPANLFSIDQLAFTQANNFTIDKLSDSFSEQYALPDDWLKTRFDATEGWYFAEFELLQQPTGLWGIYLPVIQMNAEIFLNKTRVGQVGNLDRVNSFGDPFARMLNRPQYFTVTDQLLKKGNNSLLIHVRSGIRGSGLLGRIYLDEDKILRAVFKQRFAARVTAIQVITAGMLAIAILLSVLWLLRRQDTIYGWFALMIFTWSAHNFLIMGLDIAVSQHAQDILSLLTLGWFIMFMLISTHRYLGLKFLMREKIILLAAIAGSLMLIFSGNLPWPFLRLHQVWSSFFIILSGYVLVIFILNYHQRKDLNNPLIIPAGLSLLFLGAHDWLVIIQLLPRDGGLLLHYSAPVALTIFAGLLIERFADVLRRAETLNLELEQRVTKKHRELEANYQRLRDMEHRQLLTDERERFMKEIHDGVGGHLISMLSMVRSGQQDTQLIISAIDAALEDLRLMIDSLTPQEHDIPALLGAMRSRLEPQLEHSGLQLHWQVEELPAIADFGPHKALQVMRIVQEAITNVLRHAQAENLTIKAFLKGNGAAQQGNVILIEIIDDGSGIASDKSSGHGLSNMKYRAKDIEARLEITTDKFGTNISLNLPCF